MNRVPNVDLSTAYEKAHRQWEGLTLQDCLDLGDRWAFYFVPAQGEGTGQPYTTIEKATGALGLLHIPPLSNVAVLKAGNRINIDQCERNSVKG